MAAPLGMGENLRARDACVASPCVLIAPHASVCAAVLRTIPYRIIPKTRKHFMIIEFKGMRPDVEKQRSPKKSCSARRRTPQFTPTTQMNTPTTSRSSVSL